MNIATFNGTDVVSIYLYAPGRDPSATDLLWNEFVKLVRRPLYKPVEVNGADAADTLNRVFQNAITKKEREIVITNEMLLGSDDAFERPRIWEQLVLNEGAAGFESCRFAHTSHAVLKQQSGNTETITTFQDGWSFPGMKGEISLRKGLIKGSLSSGQKTVAISDAPDVFKEGNNVYQFFFLGPWITSESFSGLLKQILGVFDFKEERAGADIILTGIPKRNEFQGMFERMQMPVTVNGVDMAEELMKRWSKAIVTVDSGSYQVREFRAEGVYGYQPLSVRMFFEKKDRQ